MVKNLLCRDCQQALLRPTLHYICFELGIGANKDFVAKTRPATTAFSSCGRQLKFAPLIAWFVVVRGIGKSPGQCSTQGSIRWGTDSLAS